MPEKARLIQFTLKLHPKTLKSLKLITAIDSNFQYQYEIFDAAVEWALENNEKLVALANSKEGSNRSYYLSKSTELLPKLEETLDCNVTRALYTSIIGYLKHREVEIINTKEL